jgi:hypothetical protein
MFMLNNNSKFSSWGVSKYNNFSACKHFSSVKPGHNFGLNDTSATGKKSLSNFLASVLILWNCFHAILLRNYIAFTSSSSCKTTEKNNNKKPMEKVREEVHYYLSNYLS